MFCWFFWNRRQNYYNILLKLVSISKKVYFFSFFLDFRLFPYSTRKVTAFFAFMQIKSRGKWIFLAIWVDGYPFTLSNVRYRYSHFRLRRWFLSLPFGLQNKHAQAWALAQDPTFSYWFDLDEIEVLEQHNQQFRDESNEEQLLPILFDIPAEGKGEFFTTAQISERLVNFGNIKKPMALSRLGMVLGQQGYEAVRPRIGGVKMRGWLVYQRDSNEINVLKRLLKP